MKTIICALLICSVSISAFAEVFKKTDKPSHQWMDLGVVVFNKSNLRLVSFEAQGLCFDQIRVKTFAEGRSANAKFWLKELWIRDTEGNVWPAAIPAEALGIQTYRVVDLHKTVCAEQIGVVGYKHNVRSLKSVYVTVSVRE
jgi:hypothetical protein